MNRAPLAAGPTAEQQHSDPYQQDCTECNGMGIQDGAGETSQKCGGEGAVPSLSDTERLDFVIAADTTWYQGRGANGKGILCYNSKQVRGQRIRAEVQAFTMREAIDLASAAIAAAAG